jgi:hypothetical protein
MIQAFEAALTAIDEHGRDEFGDEWYDRVRDRRAFLEAQYVKLHVEGRDPIDYSELPTQAAYVYSYALTRAAYVKEFLSRHRARHGAPLFSKKVITVLSFGGGPASELVGLVQYLDEQGDEPVERINYYVGDKDSEWAECARLVAMNITTDIEIELNYKRLDVINEEDMSKVDLSGTCLVILSYLMSELSKLDRREIIVQNFRTVLKDMQPGSKILFLDNKHRMFIEFFQSCKLVEGLRQRNDDGDPIEFDLPDFPKVFKKFREELGKEPRTELNAVSKLIVKYP